MSHIKAEKADKAKDWGIPSLAMSLELMEMEREMMEQFYNAVSSQKEERRDSEINSVWDNCVKMFLLSFWLLGLCD